MDRPHLIIDGNFFLHLAIPYGNREAVGPHTPSYNFFASLSQWSTRMRARSVTVCWDGGGYPKKRLELYPEYKSTRIPANLSEKDRVRHQDFVRNRSFLQTVLPFLCVRQIAVPCFEADDLIFGLSKIETHGAIILSGDMDLAQLVSSTTSWLSPGHERIHLGNISSISLDDAYDIHPRDPSDIIGFKAMRGDRSDNIKPIVKPKAVCSIWSKLTERKLPANATNIRSIASDVGVIIPDTLENYFEVVDLARSGVAGDAIAYALQLMQTKPMVNESKLFENFVAVGIQPGYIHRHIPSFFHLA